MKQGCYEFDPCSIDGSDQLEDEDEVSLDNWKPSPKSQIYRQPSKWRQESNAQGYGYMEPGIDEIKKIRAYLKNKTNDIEIMRQFAINADTLFAIKTNRYDPIEGIIKNQTDVLFKKLELLEKQTRGCQLHLQNIAENVITNDKFIKWIDTLVTEKVGQALEGMSTNG